jgi:hypothetical protein
MWLGILVVVWSRIENGCDSNDGESRCLELRLGFCIHDVIWCSGAVLELLVFGSIPMSTLFP